MLSLGAVLSVGADSVGLAIGVSDSVDVPLVLPLLPQAAALSAASPRRSAKSVFRMGTSFLVGSSERTDLGWSAGPRRLGQTAQLRLTDRRPGFSAAGGHPSAEALRLTRNRAVASGLI